MRTFCLMLIASSFFLSCYHEEFVDKSQPRIEVRTSSPGSYSVSSGVLNFPTIADFHQTVDYVIEDSVQRETFRNSLGIKTINKQAKIILDSLRNHLNFPSKISTYWPSYSNYLHSEIYSGDTILTYKKGIWGEFLNLNNTVKINGYLYQITPEKKIIVTTGDPEDLEDADNMEESDTASGIYIITPRTCLCDNTQQQWFYAEKVETDNDNQDMTSTMIFTDVTLVEFMPNSKVIVYPKWTVESNIHIRKRGMFGIWHMERENIDYRREIEFTSNFETMPGDPSPCEWGESVSWTTGLEADYNHDVTESLDDYETDVTASMPLGYCIAVRNFIQRAEINDPALEVEFSFLPFPYPDISDLHPLPPNVGCYIFDWLYFL